MLKRNNRYYSFFDFTNNFESPFFFICDHSSNYIPRKFNYLGLNSKKFSSHIAWDIGARDFTLQLTKKFKAFCFLSNFSRLLVDPNRKTNQYDLIVQDVDNTRIPGNENLSEIDYSKRLKYYNSYHKGLSTHLKECTHKNKKLMVISIHSFNKFILKKNRHTEIGLLWNKNLDLTIPLLKFFLKMKIDVGNNFPYSGFHYNYTLDKHATFNKLTNISIEIRNDLIDHKKGIDKWVKILKLALENI